MVDRDGKLWLTRREMDIPEITKTDALALYQGNGAALARALGVSRQYIHGLDAGPLPERLALKLRFVVNPEAFTATGHIRASALRSRAA